ncbi:hypothetical protein FACS1894208_08210 [Clostridia bacterium]|nr:hypothetical protein FACS1894208_08210 [Clostridia bacterium]
MVFLRDYVDFYNRDKRNDVVLTLMYFDNAKMEREANAMVRNKLIFPDCFLTNLASQPKDNSNIRRIADAELVDLVETTSPQRIDVFVIEQDKTSLTRLYTELPLWFDAIENTTFLYFINVANPYPRLLKPEQAWGVFRDFFDEDVELDYYKMIVAEREQLTWFFVNGKIEVRGGESNLQVSTQNGYRTTIGQPIDYNRRVLLFGDSQFFGELIEDKSTIASVIQQCFNNYNKKILVDNCAQIGTTLSELAWKIMHTDIQCGDIVILSKHLIGRFILELGGWTRRNERMELSAFEIKKASDYCRERGAILLYYFLPTATDKQNLSDFEENFLTNARLHKHRVLAGEIKREFKYWLDKFNIISHDFSDAFYRLTGTCFVDEVHFNARVAQVVGEHTADIVNSYLVKYNSVCRDEKFLEQEYISQTTAVCAAMCKKKLIGLKDFCETIKAEYGYLKNSGAIVMNCNPFTLGHRYLIEYSAQKVSKLYIFVVQEDRSEFSFDTRIELIKKGVADLENVTVLPGGEFVISSMTFPEYFTKSEVFEDAKIDTTTDLLVFSTCIAPALGITKRFVGEEPLDIVTRQYNQQMKELLPQFGVSVEEILRKAFGDSVISASRVRALLKEGAFNEIAKIVPQTTLDYLTLEFEQIPFCHAKMT